MVVVARWPCASAGRGGRHRVPGRRRMGVLAGRQPRAPSWGVADDCEEAVRHPVGDRRRGRRHRALLRLGVRPAQVLRRAPLPTEIRSAPTEEPVVQGERGQGGAAAGGGPDARAGDGRGARCAGRRLLRPRELRPLGAEQRPGSRPCTCRGTVPPDPGPVQDPGAGTALPVDGGDGRPHDAMGHLDERWRGGAQRIHAVDRPRRCRTGSITRTRGPGGRRGRPGRPPAPAGRRPHRRAGART
jgi:hypothetical protein